MAHDVRGDKSAAHDVRGDKSAPRGVRSGEPAARGANGEALEAAERAEAEMARRIRAEMMEQLQTEMKLMRNSQQQENFSQKQEIESLKAQLHLEVLTRKAGTHV